MQFLIFHLGPDRYGLRTRQLVRVLPLMALKQLPQAPAYIGGLMNYHGTPVPVLDLGLLACHSPCRAQFDTRMVLTDFAADDGSQRLLGLMVERVSHIADMDPNLFSEPGVVNVGAPYLGKVLATDGAIVQLVELEHLLTPEVRALLFTPDTPAPEQAAPC